MNIDKENEKQRIERLIKDEYDTIQKLKNKKREIDILIDKKIENISKYRKELIENKNGL